MRIRVIEDGRGQFVLQHIVNYRGDSSERFWKALDLEYSTEAVALAVMNDLLKGKFHDPNRVVRIVAEDGQ